MKKSKKDKQIYEKTLEKMIADFKGTVITDFLNKTNEKIELQIVEHIEKGILPPVTLTEKTFQSFCKTQINFNNLTQEQQEEFEISGITDKITPTSSMFTYSEFLDGIIENELVITLGDFIDDCVAKKKYFSVFQTEFELRYWSDYEYNWIECSTEMADFTWKLVQTEGVCPTHKDLPLWKNNPTIEEICKKIKH